jgi:mannitol/fructose-specific phosphotransferase system IIA component (Ntr-type)
MVLLTVEA